MAIIPYPEDDLPDENDLCLVCLQGYTDHAVTDFEAFLHGTCIERFLGTAAGRAVLNKGEEVIRADPETGEWQTLYPETTKARLYRQ